MGLPYTLEPQLGAARSILPRTKDLLDNNFWYNFSLFRLETKTTFNKQRWPWPYICVYLMETSLKILSKWKWWKVTE